MAHLLLGNAHYLFTMTFINLIHLSTACRLQEDRAFRYRANFDSRRRLQEDWHMAAEMKRGRELEDRLIGLESGILLHEQCDRYHRCKQCKRHLNNCGESNIWAESRYIPGSRIMV